jgi:hypothetical protein
MEHRQLARQFVIYVYWVRGGDEGVGEKCIFFLFSFIFFVPYVGESVILWGNDVQCQGQNDVS